MVKFPMSLTELRPSIQALPRLEKLQLAQELLAEFTQQEALQKAGVVLEQEYPIWTPTENVEAEITLQKLLEEDKATQL